MSNLNSMLKRLLIIINAYFLASMAFGWLKILTVPGFIQASTESNLIKNLEVVGTYSPIGLISKLSQVRTLYKNQNYLLNEKGRLPIGIPYETNLPFWLIVMAVLIVATILVLVIFGKKKWAPILPLLSSAMTLYLSLGFVAFALANNKLVDKGTAVKLTPIFLLVFILAIVAVALSVYLFAKSGIYQVTENKFKWILVGLNTLYLGSFFANWIHIQSLPRFIAMAAGNIESSVKVVGDYSLLGLTLKMLKVGQFFSDNDLEPIYQTKAFIWFGLFLVLTLITLAILIFGKVRVSIPLSIINTASTTIMSIGFVLFAHKWNVANPLAKTINLTPITYLVLVISIVMLISTAICLAERNRQNYGYIFVAPFFIMFFTFLIYPIAQTFYFTFTSKTTAIAPFEFVGFDNWLRFIGDEQFKMAFVNTWKIWGLNIVLQLGLALVLVFIFSDITWRIKGLGFFRTMFYLPNLITLASVAMLFRILLDWKYGAINQALVSAGIVATEPNWLNTPNLAQMWVGIIGAWLWFGNTFLFLMAGVQGISTEYFEAAKVDGANRRQMFFKITMPLLKPIMLYVSITSLIGGMQIFEMPQLLTDGLGAPGNGLLTMVLLLYNQYFKYKNMAYASTVAYGLFFVTMAFTFIYYRLVFAKRDKGGVN